jgi:hypothetical protein
MAEGRKTKTRDILFMDLAFMGRYGEVIILICKYNHGIP